VANCTDVSVQSAACMIPTNSSLLVCLSIGIVLGCSLAFGQDIQRLESKPQGVKSVTQPAATSFPKRDQQDPYVLSRQQSLALQQVLNPSQRRTLTGIARKIAAGGSFSSVSSSWTNLVRDVVGRGTPVDVDSLTRQVLSDSYRIANDNVSNYAEQLRMLQEAMGALQSQIRQLSYQLRALRSSLQQSTSAQQRAEISARIERTQAQMKAALEKQKALEKEIEMARHQLQRAQQEQSRMMQMMANISKMLNDSANTIVNNLK